MNLGLQLGLTGGGARGAAFDPLSLFDGGIVGQYFDFTNAGSLKQTVGGAASGIGDPIGEAVNLAGGGPNATATTTLRPTRVAGGASFDGVNQGMQTAALNLTGTDAVTVFIALKKSSDAVNGYILDRAFGGGSFDVQGPGGAGGNYSWRSQGTVSATAASGVGSFPAPDTAVLTCLGDISADQCVIRRNGVQIGTSAGDQGTGNYASLATYIGQRRTLAGRFSGTIKAMVIVGKTCTTDEIASMEAYLAAL